MFLHTPCILFQMNLKITFKANEYVPPSIPSVKQQPVEIPGVMYQSRELFQPVVSQSNKDNK